MPPVADREPSQRDDSSVRRLGRLLGGGSGGWVPTAARAVQAEDDTASVVAAMPSWAPTPQALLWLLAAGLAVVLVGGYVLSRHHGAAGASGPAAARSRATTAAAPSSPVALQLVVDVGGRVRHPGLVKLPLGARVADAIAAAGGALHARDLTSVNLAGRVADGQFLLIGVPGAAANGASAGAGGGAASPLSLNSATVEQLDALPGVGPVLAQRIVTWREQHGGYASVDQLQQVPGIGPRKFADLKALVTG